MKGKRLTLTMVRRQKEQLCSCKNLTDLATLFQIPKKHWVLMAFEPMYYHFTIPKPSGGIRAIEAPEQELKKLQRRLNAYLQSVYYLHQSVASYGYIQRVVGSAVVKNIRTNAEKHLNCKYLLNADFDDFFHQIQTRHIVRIFRVAPFHFDKHTANILAKICTYKGRLPMGAPTSPVLSNFYTLQIDNALTKWTYERKIVYTRFVDDLSFSSQKVPITKVEYQQIKKMCAEYHLKFGENKTRFYAPNDCKIVTGLQVGEEVDIPNEYYKELQKDIERLRAITEVNLITGNQKKEAHLQRFKQELMGKINFISQIKGNDSEEYLKYLNTYYDVQNPPEELSMRWTKFGNYL